MSSQINRTDENDLLQLISLHSTNKSENSQSIDQQNKSACQQFDAFIDQREFNVLEISSNESDVEDHLGRPTKAILIDQERMKKSQKNVDKKENKSQKQQMPDMECQQIRIDQWDQQSEFLNSKETAKYDSYDEKKKILQSEYVTVLESEENIIEFSEANKISKNVNNKNESIPLMDKKDEGIKIVKQAKKIEEEDYKFTKVIVIVIFLLIILQCARYFTQTTESIIIQLCSQIQNLFFLFLGCCLVGGIILQRKMQNKMKQRV